MTDWRALRRIAGKPTCPPCQTGGKEFSIDISRENLATMAGTATESVIRTLSDFRNEKLIEIKDGSITFMNQKKLEHMVN